MTDDADRPSFLTRVQLRLAAARFFTMSALLHIVLVMTAGSVVLFQQTVEPPDFVGGESGALVSTETSAAPPEPEAATPEMAPEIATPDTPTPTLDAITTTTSLTPTFTVAAAPVIKAPPTSLSTASAAASMGALSRLASGVAGGRSSFGTSRPMMDGFSGIFYDLKQTKSRQPTRITSPQYEDVLLKFVAEGWKDSLLNDYFRSPQPLFTSQFMMPNMRADEGPRAFGVERDVQPSRWAVHYKARVSPPRNGTIHFVGAGDDILMVRFNRKLVLERNWEKQFPGWKAVQNYDYDFDIGHKTPRGFAKGDAIQVRTGQWYEMEVLIGERPGGHFFAILFIEEEGVAYKKDNKGNPILPPFRVANVEVPEPDQGQALPEYARGGPVWKASPLR